MLNRKKVVAVVLVVSLMSVGCCSTEYKNRGVGAIFEDYFKELGVQWNNVCTPSNRTAGIIWQSIEVVLDFFFGFVIWGVILNAVDQITDAFCSMIAEIISWFE